MSNTETLERAYADLERSLIAARERAAQFGGPCEQCRHHRLFDARFWREEVCNHPLAGKFEFSVKTGREQFIPHEIISTFGLGRKGGVPKVCGDNRILWEPKPTRFERLLNWLGLGRA